MKTALESLLVSTPDTCGGKLRVQGTRITVLQLARLYRQGLNAEEIQASYPHLSLAQVYLALAHYHANRAEVEAELAAEAAEAEELEASYQPLAAAS